MPIFSERRRKKLRDLAARRLRIDPFSDDATYVREEGELVKLVHEIYEGDTPYPVVTHTFSGKSKAEAESYFNAHMETDRFLSAMEKKKTFKGIQGKTKKSWH